MMLTWKYTLPAFLVPFVFTLSEEGRGILLQGSLHDIVTSTATAALGVGALAAGFGGWISRPARRIERTMLIAAGTMLFYARPWADWTGLALLAVALVIHFGHFGSRTNSDTHP